jgi:hypothetical protein
LSANPPLPPELKALQKTKFHGLTKIPRIPISEKSKHFEAATKPQKPLAFFSIAVFGRFSLLSLKKRPKTARLH